MEATELVARLALAGMRVVKTPTGCVLLVDRNGLSLGEALAHAGLIQRVKPLEFAATTDFSFVEVFVLDSGRRKYQLWSAEAGGEARVEALSPARAHQLLGDIDYGK